MKGKNCDNDKSCENQDGGKRDKSGEKSEDDKNDRSGERSDEDDQNDKGGNNKNGNDSKTSNSNKKGDDNKKEGKSLDLWSNQREKIVGKNKGAFRWDDESWERMFEMMMKRFKATGSWVVLRVKDNLYQRRNHELGKCQRQRWGNLQNTIENSDNQTPTIHPDNSLYHWMISQRKLYKSGRLQSNTPERYRKLKEAGFPFVITREESNRRRNLALYGDETKPFHQIEPTTTGSIIKVGKEDKKSSNEDALNTKEATTWKSDSVSSLQEEDRNMPGIPNNMLKKTEMNEKQKLQARAKTSAELTAKLTSSFEYGPLMTNWLTMWTKLLAHVQREGRWVVFKAEDSSLYYWAHDQRKLYRKNVLQTTTPQRYQLMKDAGFPFEPLKDKQLQIKIKPMKEIPPGFTKVPSSDEWWEHQYNKLKEYYEKHKTNIVSEKKEKKLHSWTHSQVKTYRKGKLSKEREEKLRQIGCPLDKWFFASNTPPPPEGLMPPGANKKQKRPLRSMTGSTTKENEKDGENQVQNRGIITSHDNISTMTGPSGRLWSPRVNQRNEESFDRILERLKQWQELNGNWDVKKKYDPLLYRYVLKFTARSKCARTAKSWRTPGRIQKLRQIGFPIDNYLSSEEGEDDDDNNQMLNDEDERECQQNQTNECCSAFEDKKTSERTFAADAKAWEEEQKEGESDTCCIVQEQEVSRKRKCDDINDEHIQLGDDESVNDYESHDGAAFVLPDGSTTEMHMFVGWLKHSCQQ